MRVHSLSLSVPHLLLKAGAVEPLMLWFFHIFSIREFGESCGSLPQENTHDTKICVQTQEIHRPVKALASVTGDTKSIDPFRSLI